jgi:hypothetical protein
MSANPIVWRLKGARAVLLATKCPTTGEVLLPQTGVGKNGHKEEFFNFDKELLSEPREPQAEVGMPTTEITQTESAISRGIERE